MTQDPNEAEHQRRVFAELLSLSRKVLSADLTITYEVLRDVLAVCKHEIEAKNLGTWPDSVYAHIDSMETWKQRALL